MPQGCLSVSVNPDLFHSPYNGLNGCCCYCSVTKLCSTLCNIMDCNTSGFPVLQYLPEFAQTYVHWVSDAIQPSYPQSFPASGSFPMSHLFTSGGQSIGASASTSVLPMNIQDWFPLGLTWFDLLAVQGSLKSLLQHHGLKASILGHSAFFMVQLSHLSMTIGIVVLKKICTSQPQSVIVTLLGERWLI